MCLKIKSGDFFSQWKFSSLTPNNIIFVFDIHLKNGAIRLSYSSIYDRSMNIAKEAKTMRMKFLRGLGIKELP